MTKSLLMRSALLPVLALALASAAPAKAEMVTYAPVTAPVTAYASPYGYYPAAAMPVSYAVPVNSRYAVPVAYSMPVMVARAASTKILNTRFGDMSIVGDTINGLHHYAININGVPLFSASYQSDRMMVSEVYKLVDEDVMIFTVDGKTPGCKVRNFLMSLRSNGTFVGPTEIGDCQPGYKARLFDNGLLVEFEDEYRKGDMAAWRYKYGAMERL